jgi:hypothetical protein
MNISRNSVVVGLVLAIAAVLVATGLVQGAANDNISADVNNGPLRQSLNMYKGLAQVEYVTSSNVILDSGVVSFKFNGKSRESALDIIRRAVLLQTGVVITPIDGKRASITFNDRFVPVNGKLEE